jgi:hypothetical protein
MTKRNKLDRLRSMSQAAKDHYEDKPCDVLMTDEGPVPVSRLEAGVRAFWKRQARPDLFAGAHV